jgi:hypothetical protein
LQGGYFGSSNLTLFSFQAIYPEESGQTDQPGKNRIDCTWRIVYWSQSCFWLILNLLLEFSSILRM